MRKYGTPPTNTSTNPLITFWRHAGCNLDSKSFDSIYQSIALTWAMSRFIRKLRKSMSPRHRKAFDATQIDAIK